MQIRPECIQCVLNVSLASMRRFTSDEEMIRKFLREILKSPPLRGMAWDITCPEIFEMVTVKMTDLLNAEDPFHSIKIRQNEMAMEIYPGLQGMIEAASDPLYMAAKLAIVGNSIDFRTSGRAGDVETLLRERLEAPLSAEDFSKFRARLKESKTILYFGDNAGEVVFDKLFIGQLKKTHHVEVIFVVRKVPTFNDITKVEAGMVGMDEMAAVIENGIEGPLPGTILSRCSDEIRKLVGEADVIISKGGGNFDTLDEERDIHRDLAFMLMCKCTPYADFFQSSLNHPIFHMR